MAKVHIVQINKKTSTKILFRLMYIKNKIMQEIYLNSALINKTTKTKQNSLKDPKSNKFCFRPKNCAQLHYRRHCEPL